MSGVAGGNSKFKSQKSKVRMSANSLISIVKELGFGDQTPTKWLHPFQISLCSFQKNIVSQFFLQKVSILILLRKCRDRDLPNNLAKLIHFHLFQLQE